MNRVSSPGPASATVVSGTDYAREVVPEAVATRPALAIALITSNAIMSVPIIVLGATLGADYGLTWSLLAILLGCAITAAIAALSAFAGVRSRRSAALLMEETFGLEGSKLLNVAMAIALVGWFAVELGFIGDMVSASVAEVFGLHIGREWGILGAAAIAGMIALAGIALVVRAPMVFLPFLTALLVLVLALTLSSPIPGASSPLTPKPLGTGVSAIVGTYIVGCLIMPDYSRFIRTATAAAGATIFALGPVYALVLGTYAAASLATHETAPSGIITGLGLPAAVALILPIGLLQNCIMCLYSSSLTVSTLAKFASWRAITLTTVLIGVGLAASGANALFVDFLVTLGIVFPPAVALLIFTGFSLGRSAQTRPALWIPASIGIWGLGIATGAASAWYQLGITGFPALDGFVVAAIGASVTRIWGPQLRPAWRSAKP